MDIVRGGVKLAWNAELRPIVFLDKPMRDGAELADVLAKFVQEVACDVLSIERYDSEVIAIDPDKFRTFSSPGDLTPRHCATRNVIRRGVRV